MIIFSASSMSLDYVFCLFWETEMEKWHVEFIDSKSHYTKIIPSHRPIDCKCQKLPIKIVPTPIKRHKI